MFKEASKSEMHQCPNLGASQTEDPLEDEMTQYSKSEANKTEDTHESEMQEV